MYLIDTDICIEFLRGDKDIIKFFSDKKDLFISIITLSELFFGVYNSGNQRRHKKALHSFLGYVEVIDVSFPIAYNYGIIKSKLKKKGNFIGDFDILIGATSIVFNLPILTRNVKHYNKIKGVKIVSV